MAPSIFPSTPTDLPLMRMQLLWQHALTHLKHSPQLSAYYTSRMRLVAQQQRVALPKAMLARFCAACSLIHVPGVNCDLLGVWDGHTAAVRH
ncbi:hypothetical protein KFE25_001803 [Diacronema lutheri]|uniref:Uncharacterized protein n=1 Tax=Diacronema lutheri TaxID=2081491 RepID=A0A8J5XPF1_DIALT|nr:hypothetical protein KFE25_001803 [Diacronema lutheri]